MIKIKTTYSALFSHLARRGYQPTGNTGVVITRMRDWRSGLIVELARRNGPLMRLLFPDKSTRTCISADLEHFRELIEEAEKKAARMAS